MALTFWSWRDGAPRLGISDSGPKAVLDLAFLDRRLTSLTTLWKHLQRVERDKWDVWLTELLAVHSERENIEGCAWHFPAPVSDVWTAGVTYERSRDARTEETDGAEDLYWRVYTADRPEIFYKGHGERLAAPGAFMGLRRDATWHVPEPELAVLLGPDGKIFGFTVANDLSARDIEGANPLYLPQAKIFHRSGAGGPSVALASTIDSSALDIQLDVVRQGASVFRGAVRTTQMSRSVEDLVSWLGKEWELMPWTILMTGTGIVPHATFALQDGDEMVITITGIGTLRNVARRIAPDWARVEP